MSADERAIRVPVGRSQPGASAPATIAPERLEGLTPLIDIHEGPEGLVLEADLPGVLEEALTVQLEDNVLSLHARRALPPVEGGRVLHEEFRPGEFARSFILSDEVDRTRITASLRNGVLRIVLPKAERTRTRRIEVSSS
jgi:HSP20 family molecular chaperone IbpA